MAKAPKSRGLLSRIWEALRGGKARVPNRAADVMKSPEEEVKRLVLAAMALSEAPPGQFDPKEAMRVKLELEALILAIQDAKEATDREYFDWLEANFPEMSSIKGRPNWSESEKVTGQDEALLKDFEDTLARNVAAIGKKHRASQKTYSDLADNGDEDEETVKQRVMRARRRQKALNETIQDISRLAALAETDRGKVIAPKEYEERREKLLEAFRRLLRTK